MSYIYFPGCQYTGLSPEVSNKIKQYMEQRFGMTITGCCRSNYTLLAPEDTAVCVCPTCFTELSKNAPHARVLSVWEVLAEDGEFPWPDYRNLAVTVQDCIDTCDKRSVQDAVRKVLLRMNVQIVEISRSFTQADFCRPRTKEQEAAVLRQCQEYETEVVVCYCTGCYKALKLGDVCGYHLLDFIFGNV